jgi:hypothetical protein
MALGIVRDVRRMYAGMHTNDIRRDAWRSLTVGLIASGEEGYRAMELFLAPDEWADVEVSRVNGANPAVFDLILSDPGQPLPDNASLFDVENPSATIEAVVARHSDLELPLARNLPRFRGAVSERIIHRISRENAMFALMTALPNAIPGILDVPWTVGEFATDTAFLTMNQLRMAMLLAAVHDREIGYRSQKMEMAAIVGGAFGWRAIARELVGMIPLGGGLIPKAAVAFAGTWVTGLGLEKLNRSGVGLSKEEKRDAYIAALDKGRETVRELAPTHAKRA